MNDILSCTLCGFEWPEDGVKNVTLWCKHMLDQHPEVLDHEERRELTRILTPLNN